MSARRGASMASAVPGAVPGAAAMPLHAAIADALRARARLEQRDFAGPAGSTKAC